MAGKVIATSKNGESVFLYDQQTNVALHILESPNLIDLVREVILESELVGDNVAIEKDLGRVVGETTLIETFANDVIVYAKRLHSDKFTRFVKNKSALPTNFVTIILHKTDDGYNIWSAWCGKLVPTSPGGEDEMPKSQGFWGNHALVYDEKIIQPNTETQVCPWQ